MSSLVKCSCLLLASVSTCALSKKQWIVDALHGDDAATGDHPSRALRTLERARVAVAEWRREQTYLGAPSSKIEVLLRAGEYEPLVLGPSDSGNSADDVVTWAAYPGEQPIISAGFRVPASAIHSVPHPKRHGQTVQHVTLSKLGFTPSNYGSLSGENGGSCTTQKMEASMGDTSMQLARYPNPFLNGTWRWMYVDKPVGWSPACTNKSIHAPPCGASRQDFVWAEKDTPTIEDWMQEDDPWLHGYFQFDWTDTIARIESVHPQNRTVDIDPATPTHGTEPIRRGARWMGLNLLSELDAPSEYWLDRKQGDLYFIPPSGASGELIVSVNGTAVASNASNIQFVGIHVKYSQGNGMVLLGDHISVINCSSSNHGGIGIILYGRNNAIRGSTVHHVGCAGMSIQSGNRTSLSPGGTTIEGNALHDFSLWKRMYQPGIHFDGVGNSFEGNTMYRAPHSGMLGRADNSNFTGNNFTELCTESGDAGAWYSGRSWADRGNSITYNTFDRIKNTGAPIPLQAQNVHAIHFDDQMSGYFVHGNVISNSWAGIKLGGGRRTTITNNTFVHTHNAIEFDNRGETWQRRNCDPAQANSNPHSFFQELWRDFNASSEWFSQFPYLGTIADDYPCVPVYNTISNNTYCKCDTWITATASQIASWHSTAENNINISGC